MPAPTVTVRAAESSATTSPSSPSDSEAVRAVGDRVEAVARSQHLELRLLPHELPHVRDRRGRRSLSDPYPVIARPVDQRVVPRRTVLLSHPRIHDYRPAHDGGALPNELSSARSHW